MNPSKTKQYSNTNIDEVKRQNDQSGLSYNEVKRLLGEKFLKEQK